MYTFCDFVWQFISLNMHAHKVILNSLGDMLKGLEGVQTHASKQIEITGY